MFETYSASVRMTKHRQAWLPRQGTAASGAFGEIIRRLPLIIAVSPDKTISVKHNQEHMQ